MTVKELATKNGFKSIRRIKSWNGFACYEALATAGNPEQPVYIGLPQLIFEKRGQARFANYDEIMAYLDAL